MGKRVWRPALPEFVGPDLSPSQRRADLKGQLHNQLACFSSRRTTRRRGTRRSNSWIDTLAYRAISGSRSPSSWSLKPDYSSLLDRGFGRIFGTIIGATFAALLVGGLHPRSRGHGILGRVFSAWAAYSTWYASFAISFGFVTSLVLVLMSISTTDTLSTALDRLIDFSLGSVIALVAYLVWPTSLHNSVGGAMANLYQALERYLDAVFDIVEAWDTFAPRTLLRSLEPPAWRGYAQRAQSGERSRRPELTARVFPTSGVNWQQP